MGFCEPKNIFQQVSLLFHFTKTLGLYPSKCCGIKSLGYLYTILLLISYYICFYFIERPASNIFKELETISDTATMRKCGFYFNIIYLSLMMISSMYNSYRVELAYEEINDIDRNFLFLNVRFNYVKCMKRDIVHVLSAIFAAIIFNLIDYYAFLNQNSDYVYILIWIVTGIPEFVNTIVISSFVILSNNINLRFERMSEITGSLMGEKILPASFIFSDINNAFRLKLLILQYVKLHKTVILANKAYGFQLTTSYIIYFIRIWIHLYVVFTKIHIISDIVDVIIYLLWMCSDIGKFVYVQSEHRYTSKSQIAAQMKA